jgi:hypothetical protein
MNRPFDSRVLKMAAFCVALSGCTVPGPHHLGGPVPKAAPTPCNPGICVIKVKVTDCAAVGGITVDPDYVSADQAVNMRWAIETAGYEFTSQGIQFFPPNPQFETQPSPRPSEFRIQNHKIQPGDYYYFVNVTGCRPADPWVRNN